MVSVVVIIESLICIAGMGIINVFYATAVAIIALLTLLYYYLKTKKEFGGVTGDTAGYFLMILERNTLIAIAITCTVLRLIVKQ